MLVPVLAIENPSPDLQLAIEQVKVGGEILVEGFSRPIGELGVERKHDRIRSEVSAIDVLASNTIVGNIGRRTGEKTVTEEYDRIDPELKRFSAPYGTRNAWVLDPLDGTRNYLDAIENGLESSFATVSLAKLIAKRPVVGALMSPLLAGLPRLYTAEAGKGAFREVGPRGSRSPLLMSLQTKALF